MMMKDTEKAKWHRALVVTMVILSVAFPLTCRSLSFSGHGSYGIVKVAVPGAAALAPILINVSRRAWVFNAWALIATWVFAGLLLVLAGMFDTIA